MLLRRRGRTFLVAGLSEKVGVCLPVLFIVLLDVSCIVDCPLRQSFHSTPAANSSVHTFVKASYFVLTYHINRTFTPSNLR